MGRSRVNVSLSPEALGILARLQRQTGLNRSAVLELLVREEAARREIGPGSRRTTPSRSQPRGPSRPRRRGRPG